MDAGKSKPNELRQERLHRGWTQEQVADELYKLCGSKGGTRGDINANMVSRWENGKYPPSIFWQNKLCELYGKTAEELRLNSSMQTTNIQAIHVTQAINERLDQAESIINLAWEAWFASRPKQATREITKLLPNLEKLIYTSISTIHVLRGKSLIIRCHGLLGAVYLDAL